MRTDLKRVIASLAVAAVVACGMCPPAFAGEQDEGAENRHEAIALPQAQGQLEADLIGASAIISAAGEGDLPASNASLMGSVTWNDDDDAEGTRPTSVTVRLLVNGTEVASQAVTPDEELGLWIWRFNDVPTMGSDGGGIDYKIIQDPVEGYDTTTLVGEGIEIRNVLDNVESADSPAFRTHALTLDGKIGVQFFLELPDIEGTDWTASHVDFSVGGKGAFESVDAFDASDRSGTGAYYGFECDVSSIQMADRIIATLRYNQDGVEKAAYQTYSVADYVKAFDRLLAADPDAFDAKTVALVHAMADFGHYAQPYLASLRDWEVDVDYAEMPAASAYSSDTVAAAREGTAPYVTGYHFTTRSERDIDRLSVALNLETDTSLYVFAYTRGGASITGATLADGTPLPVERVSDNCWRAEVPGIMAQRLDDEFEVEMTTSGRAEFSTTVSALSIARDLVRSNDQDARFAGTALYNYWKAADDYLS